MAGATIGTNTLGSCRQIEGQPLQQSCRWPAANRPRKQQKVSAVLRTGKASPASKQEATADQPLSSSTSFLVALAAVNSAAAGAALAAATAASAPVQGPQSVPAIVSTQGGQTVDKAVSTAVDAVKATGGLVKSGLGVASDGFSAAKQTYAKVAPVVEDAVSKATPYVKTAAKTAGDVAGPVVKAVTPVVKSGLGEVERFINRTGVQPDAIVRKGTNAAEQAGDIFNRNQPQISKSINQISASDPTTLGKYALGLAALYFFGPAFLKTLFGSFRGYRGDISPAAALDSLANDGNTILVDVRTAREKESGGIPDIPNSGKLVELEFASVDNRGVRGQLRNVNAVERTMTVLQIAGLKKVKKGTTVLLIDGTAKMTVLQIAALKKVKKGTTVLLMDKNGSTAKAIAKELSGRGFRRVFVINGGFSGWTGSKLQTKLGSSVSAVEILSPGNLFGTQRMGSQRSTQTKLDNFVAAVQNLLGNLFCMRYMSSQQSTQAGRRALPSGR